MQHALWTTLSLEDFSPSTVDKYARDLRRAARTGLDVAAFMTGSAHAWQAGEAWRLGRLTASRTARRNDARLLNILVKVCRSKGWHDALIHWPSPRPTPPQRRSLPDQDLGAVLSAAGEASPRDAAVLEVALLTGAGRREMSLLRLQDVDVARQRIYVRGARGHRDAWLPVEGELWRPDGPLIRYLQVRRRPVDVPEALWVTQTIPHRALKPAGIYKILRRLGGHAGVGVNLNITRHTRGRRLWLHWRQEELVQIYLRQTTRQATPIYTEPSIDDVHDLVRLRGGPGLRGPPQPACPTCRH